MGHLAVLEPGDHAYREPNEPTGGCDGGKERTHGYVVGERHHQFVHDLSGADGPGDSLHRCVLGPQPVNQRGKVFDV